MDTKDDEYHDDDVATRVGHCTLPPVEPRSFPAGFDPGRASAILVSADKWANGTELRYHFVEDAPHAADQDVVRAAFETWHKLPIGLAFREVSDPLESEIRIGFDHEDGSWSYVGRQVLRRPAAAKTMNFGWRLDGWSYGRDTALHEIGHTLGLPHEHQNPKAGIVWDEEAVIAHFAAPPNEWSREQTEWNILRKIPPDAIQGSAWDPDSIMHYQFEAGLIVTPDRYQREALIPEAGLSERDDDWVARFYPPLESGMDRLRPFESARLSLGPGEQADFEIVPEATRTYTFRTFGSADTVMVLFEDVGSGPAESQGLRFVTGDDDSGTDRNAQFAVKLFKGRRYVLRVRLYWDWATGETAVMLW